jgi:hypothetical protein
LVSLNIIFQLNRYQFVDKKDMAKTKIGKLFEFMSLMGQLKVNGLN